MSRFGSPLPRKPYRTLDELIDLLQERSLEVHDRAACARFLQDHNYYRFSGYGRYFQIAPSVGNNNYRPGVTFNDIGKMYDLDVEVRRLLGDALSQAEVLIRSRFVHLSSADESWAYEGYFDETRYHPGKVNPAEHILADLDRSKEPFILHHRVEREHGRPDYSDLPFWAAADVLAFGTLSKAIEYLADDEPKHALAESLGQKRMGFTSRVRSFVHLRNRCAHHSRLWNAYMSDAPSLPPNISRRFKREHGSWNTRSVFATAVALQDFHASVGSTSTFWEEFTDLLAQDARYRAGVMNPTHAS